MCEVLAAHGAGSDEHEYKQSRRSRSPIVVFATARLSSSGGVPPQCSSTGKEDTWDVWSEDSRGGYGEGEWLEHNRKYNDKKTHKCH